MRDEKPDAWSVYGVDDVLDSTKRDYVTVGTGCWHRMRYEK